MIGRGTNCNVRLGDPKVSRTHLKVSYLSDKVVITDLSQYAGTYVNGEQIFKSAELQPGDEIVAGQTRMFLSRPRIQKEIDVEAYTGVVHAELGQLTGTWVSNFFLKKVIGIGKTGLVFEAFDEKKQKIAAVKVYSKKFTSCEKRTEKLVESMRAFCKIRGPHLVQLYQAGKNSAAHHYAAMNIIDGENLACLIQKDGIESMLEWQEAWRCACQITIALNQIFDNNRVHRNVTPSNIIRRHSDNSYYLGDFASSSTVSATDKAWQREEFFSQIHFLPPERLRETSEFANDEFGGLPLTGVADIRSDIFGLGACCYAMLTGRPPAIGANLDELINNIHRGSPPVPTRRHMSVNEHFESVVMKMISRNPDERFREPRELLKELYRTGRLNGLDV